MKIPDIEKYRTSSGEYSLPPIPGKTLKLLKKKQKPVVLKQEIIRKNKTNHPEISLAEYKELLFSGLYEPQEVLQPNFKNKPKYFNFIAYAEKNNVVVVELAEEKRRYEIVGFFRINNYKLNKMRKKTNRDGGQSIITG